jgi:hypothetical protein
MSGIRVTDTIDLTELPEALLMTFSQQVIQPMLLLALTLLLDGCPPSPPPVPPPAPDASDASAFGEASPALVDASPAPPWPDAAPGPCRDACAVLLGLHCPEGAAQTCPATLQKTQDARLVRAASGQPMTCAMVASATTTAAVRSVGVGCVGVP